jgi:hypothetical protein
VSKPWRAFEKKSGKEPCCLAFLQVDRQETSLPYVDIPKPQIRKCRELHGCGLHLRIRFAYYPPKELRLSCSSMLMALEEFQRNSQQGLAICLEAHSSLHQSQVRDVWKQRESAQ